MLLQLLIIFIVTYVGILIPELLHIPIPGAIVGMFLLFLLLVFKGLKLKSIEKSGDLLLNNMVLIFLPPSIKLLNYITLLKDSFFRVVILIIVTTIITMIVTGKTVNFLIERKEKKNGVSK